MPHAFACMRLIVAWADSIRELYDWIATFPVIFSFCCLQQI